MRRNATKVAAAVLTLAVTMTSVNIPTTAAAAKKVKLTPAKKTLTVGKTVTLKLKEGTKNVTTKAKFTSSNKKIATVGKKGKVTAKKKGTATITATYKKKKYKCKITVKAKATPKPTTKPTTKPTQAPEPTTAPTQAPSTEPTTAPTQTPSADTVGAITSFKAVKADTFEVTFDKAQPEAVTAEVTKGTSKVDLTSTWNNERTVLTLVSAAKLTVGEYTVTAKNGENSVTSKTTVENEKVAEIKILNDIALTGKAQEADLDNSEAYIYYDVVNQYGESMRSSTSISWNSSAAKTQVDASAGKITIKAGEGKTFTYGTEIYITGVNAKSGVSISKSVKIGMPQAVDSVKFASFVVSKDARTTKVASLPKNFAKNTYYLLFTAYDQNGNPLPASDIKKSDLTFISNAPMLIDSSMSLADEKDGTINDIFTIDGEDYKGVVVNPGQYVDKGGEVTVTVISNKTGKKSEQLFKIGGNAVLKSLTLSAPSGIVADGDVNIKIPFTAKDTDGNTVTSYETIVRSSNAVNLTASEGTTLEIREENDGSAGIYWSDDVGFDENGAINHNGTYGRNKRFSNASAYNDMDRSISLSTIVIGGESSNLMLNVADARRPVAIKSVKLNGDDNNAIVAGNTAKVGIAADDPASGVNGQIKYLDQYNAELSNDDAKAFFKLDKFNGKEYVISTKTTSNGNKLGLLEDNKDKTYQGENGIIEFKAADDVKTSEEIVTVKYSIATKENGAVTDVSRAKSIAYTIVPQKDVVNDLEIIANSSLYQLETPNSKYPNGTTIGGSDVASGSSILNVIDNTKDLPLAAANDTITVKGKTRNGLALTLPGNICNSTDDSVVKVVDGKVKSVSGGAIAWYELYDVNSTRYTRINATKTISLNIYGENNVSKNISISDAYSAPAKVEFRKDWAAKNDVIINPSRTEIAAPKVYTNTVWKGDGTSPNDGFGIIVYDQYGKIIDSKDMTVTLRVSGLEEKTSDYTHLVNSFTIAKNGSSANVLETPGLKISGAEIGDKFKLTATVDRYGISKDVVVTVGSDTNAKVSNNTIFDLDKNFRTAPSKPENNEKPGLGMNR